MFLPLTSMFPFFHPLPSSRSGIRTLSRVPQIFGFPRPPCSFFTAALSPSRAP